MVQVNFVDGRFVHDYDVTANQVIVFDDLSVAIATLPEIRVFMENRLVFILPYSS